MTVRRELNDANADLADDTDRARANCATGGLLPQRVLDAEARRHCCAEAQRTAWELIDAEARGYCH